MAEKLNLKTLKNPKPADAAEFVAGANVPAAPSSADDRETRLIVEGHLKNRRETCRPVTMLYIKNPTADWIDRHAIAGRGGAQIVLNYLLERGIAAVEAEFQPGRPVIARDEAER